MRELVTLLIFGAACWWMSGLDGTPAAASLDEVPGLGVGIADAMAGDLSELLRVSRSEAESGGSVWSGMDIETATSFIAWGRPGDLRRIELSFACHRGGVLGRPDRAQIDAGRERLAQLLQRVGAGAATEWATGVIEAFVRGDERPRGKVVDGIRVRIGFEARFDLVVVRIDRASAA